MSKTQQYEVRPQGKSWIVWSNEKQLAITKLCPKHIAEEICEDFNKMANKDYTPIGGPNMSKAKKN